jgi:pleiotropic regulator 1
LFQTQYFLGVTKAPEDEESQRIKVASKVRDEYALVKDLPPVLPSTSKALVAPNTTSTSLIPATPTADTKEEKTQQDEEMAEVVVHSSGVVEMPEATFHKVIQDVSSRQESGPTQSWSLMDISKAAGHSERIQPPSRALVAAGGGPSHKPTWHPPWKLMRVISGHLGWVRSLDIDASNEWFATGSADRTIKIWDLATGTLKLTLTGHINAVRGLAISPRHPYLFSAGEDKMIKCWDLEYNKVIRHYHGHLSGVYCLSIHPTIDVIVTGGRDSSARVWDIRSKQQVHILTGHTNTVMDVKCQATDPQVITGAADSTVRLWDLAAGRAQAVLTNHKKGIRSLLVHPKEYSFASGAADNIKHFKCPDGLFVKNFSGQNTIINTISVNPDNVMVSGGDNGSIYFWDWVSGYNFQQLTTTAQPGSLESEAGIFASAFDVTGSRFITCEADKTIKVWKEDDSATPETHPIRWKETKQKARF